MRATCRDGSEAIACPSSSTAPEVGRSSRAMPRSRVDLPHALAPTMHGDLAVGHVGGQLVHDRRGRRTPGSRRWRPAGSRRPCDRRRRCRTVASSGPPRGASGGQQPQQERCPEGTGDDADGVVHVGDQVRRDVVARRPRSRRRPAPAPTRVVRPPFSARAIGPARNATKAIGPAAATPSATSRTATSSSASERRGVTPRPGGGVLPELGHPAGPRRARTRHGASSEQQQRSGSGSWASRPG